MRLQSGYVAATAIGTALLATLSPSWAAEELNALVWCDHADPDLLAPFEEANDVRVNVKEFEGTGAGLAIVEQSQPGDWDVMVIDSVDVPRVADSGLFAELPEDQLPFGDLFPEVVLDSFTKQDGKRYAITEKFGYNSISYNKDAVDPAAMTSLQNLLGGEYQGKIAIYDYYLPVMGMAALALGKTTADLTADDLPAIRDLLVQLKSNAALVADVVGSQTAIATGEVDVLVGGGEWVTAGLAEENPALEFAIPDEGGILWSQALAIFADSERQDLALKFVQYVMSPEGQARLATSSCYWGMPANTQAALSDEQKKILRFDEQSDFLAKSQLYPAPDAALDKAMQDVWTDMLQSQ
ncbi:MAG: spermidine/putrescine ABC transporter substrate-binding protein [Alphaproteobacteria bacterium]